MMVYPLDALYIYYDSVFSSFPVNLLLYCTPQMPCIFIMTLYLPGALELLREFAARPGVPEARGEQGGYSHLCKRLADLSLEKCPPLTTRDLVDTLYDTGYIGTGDPSLLGYIVRAQVNR